MIKQQDIVPVTIEEEMKTSYLQYAMSVIVSRALPDVRDGLKPVHRRILFAMKEANNDWNRAYRKSARAVGDVMGKYHPHGDMAIYDAMVRMVQDFSLRVPLVDGQGNFGSMDGDPAAAPRYTEARLSHPAHFLLEDLDKETVDFVPNFDDKEFEPVVLPARFPNLLVNGAGGIAVAMATNIPPHNMTEVINACCAYIDNPEVSIDELMGHILGPDFPTGGIILGRNGIREAYRTGRGSIIVRGKTHVEVVRKEREAIIVTEIPYQVNKSRMIERMAEVVKDKIIEGISDLRDESDRDGVRVVIELKRDAVAEVVLNQLYRYTPLQVFFSVNMLALNARQPQMMNLKDIISLFIEFREEVTVKRIQFDLKKARERAHILIGLAVAVANIDEIIRLIRGAADPAIAKEQLMERAWPVFDLEPLLRLVSDRIVIENSTYHLTETQTKAILDLRLHRLTGLERDKIAGELHELVEKIQGHLTILNSRALLMGLIRKELTEVAEKFPDKRRTAIDEMEFMADMEDLIAREDMVITVSHAGYIKRVPVTTYRAQKRGGKGRSGMATREEDFVNEVFVANTHTPVLFFSSIGQVYQMKVYKLPLGNPQSRGKAMINLLPLSPGEVITTVMPLPEDETTWAGLHIMFATSIGTVRRNALSDFLNIKANGKIAMKLEEGEQLVGVQPCRPTDHVLLTTCAGKCIRFNVDDVRLFAGRNSVGVRGIRLADKDRVISLSILDGAEFSMEERDSYLRQANALRRSGDEPVEAPTESATQLPTERFEQMAAQEQFILSVTVNGFGKRTSAYEYRVTGRGGQGIANIDTSERNGQVVASFPVGQTDDLVMVTDGGQIIRCPVHDIRIAGRKTQGVTLLRVAKGEKVVSVSRIEEPEDDGSELPEGDETEIVDVLDEDGGDISEQPVSAAEAEGVVEGGDEIE
jgi:DNA gyrase subunit A